MLTLENVSFEVQAEKGQKEMIGSLLLLQAPTEAESLPWPS